MSAAPETVEPVVTYLSRLRAEIETGLTQTLAAFRAPSIIVGAMEYSLMAGGKRLRPCLTLAGAESAGATRGLQDAAARRLALPAAIAVEMIHTYSLIHDDLPAMDNDALRRGRPTSHVVHGDGLAVLAGDGLLTEAFAVITAGSDADADRRLRAANLLATAAGAAGMVGGQAIDLAAAGRVPGRHTLIEDADSLRDMHARKTGALLCASSVIGAVLTGADDAILDAITDYGREVGLAFQIVDDVLDVEGSNEALGKTAGKDAVAGKPTYPSLYGVAESRRMAAACVERAKAALARERIGGRLGDIADWSLSRRA